MASLDEELMAGVLNNLYRAEAVRLAKSIWPPEPEQIPEIAREAVNMVNQLFPDRARAALERDRDMVEATLRGSIRSAIGAQGET